MKTRSPSPDSSARPPDDRDADVGLVEQDSDRVVTVALSLGWLATSLLFWRWWLSTDHWVTPIGIYLTSLAIAVTFSFGAWYLMFSLRKAPAVPTAIYPGLRLAAVVTKAPSEPWAVVRQTLRALLDQAYPYPYDVWLADEDPSTETLAWCEANGVRVSCRKGLDDYHRETWPRRTKCKEGNLAYFYDRWGYDLYDVVAQFDADHVPEPSYLSAVVPYFNDPSVGYVAAPSICDAKSDRSWMARGRLHREALFHGAFQMKSDGLASLCIGSHYTVRTEAVASVGGIGPELAEDFSTSFFLTAGGWNGRFAGHAFAHGEGPESFADAIRQEMQWARSLVVLLLDQTRGLWSAMRPAQRIRLGFSLFYYPIFVAQMVLGLLFAPIALMTGVPWVDVSLVEYLVRAALPVGCIVALVVRQKARGLMRPIDAPFISWEGALFHVARWPWVLAGVAQAVVGHLTGRKLDIVVTPKGTEGPKELPLKPVLPYWGLSVSMSLIVILAPSSSAAAGYYLIGLFHAAVYAGIVLAIALLHRRENPALPWGSVAWHVVLAIVAVDVLLFGIVVREGDIGHAIRSAAFLPIPYDGASPSAVLTSFLTSGPARAYLVGFIALALWSHLQLRGRSYRNHRGASVTEPPLDLGDDRLAPSTVNIRPALVPGYPRPEVPGQRDLVATGPVERL